MKAGGRQASADARQVAVLEMGRVGGECENRLAPAWIGAGEVGRERWGLDFAAGWRTLLGLSGAGSWKAELYNARGERERGERGLDGLLR